MATTRMVTAAMLAHASVLLMTSQRWARGIDNHTQRAFVCFSSSRLGSDGAPVYYRAAIDGSGCTCPGHRNRGVCCHSVATRMEAERAREMIARKVPSFETMRNMYPGCANGCGRITDGNTFCEECSSDRERQQRMAAKRENQQELRRINALLFGSAED